MRSYGWLLLEQSNGSFTTPPDDFNLDDDGSMTRTIYSPIHTTMDTNTTIVREINSSTIVSDFTMAEVCSFELMTLLGDAGCPLNTYEKVVSLLKKQEKRGFSYSHAHSRHKLLDLLRRKFHCPSIQSSSINNCEIFSFPFVDMLQDLVDTAGSNLHKISPIHD